jgi:hypothetical protein
MRRCSGRVRMHSRVMSETTVKRLKAEQFKEVVEMF